MSPERLAWLADYCDECEHKHHPDAEHLFRCIECQQLKPWSQGADDDLPDSCDNCWSKRHADPAVYFTPIGGQ